MFPAQDCRVERADTAIHVGSQKAELESKISSRPELVFMKQPGIFVSGAATEPTTDSEITLRNTWLKPATWLGSSSTLSSKLTPPSERV